MAASEDISLLLPFPIGRKLYNLYHKQSRGRAVGDGYSKANQEAFKAKLARRPAAPKEPPGTWAGSAGTEGARGSQKKKRSRGSVYAAVEKSECLQEC